MKWQPRLSSVLFFVNTLILILPLSGIAVLRIYESALVRQTESELISQAAFVAANYRAIFRRLAPQGEILTGYGRDIETQWRQPASENSRWRPHPPRLDLATDFIFPKASTSPLSNRPADSIAKTVGSELTEIIRNAQVTTLSSIRVVDFHGIVVASTASELFIDLSQRQEIGRALQGEHVSLIRQRISDEPPPSLTSISRGTGIRIFVSHPILHGDRILGAVLLSRTPKNIVQALHSKRWLLFQGVLVLIFIVALTSFLTSYLISRPIRSVIQQTTQAVKGKRGAVVPLKEAGTLEISALSNAVAELAQTLEQRADYIQDLANHISHEFKTPLTSIQGAVELLQDHMNEMSADERTKFLNNMAKDAQRMEKLVKRLLDLAKADMVQVHNQSCDANKVIQALVKNYLQRGITIDMDCDIRTISVNMDGETLGSLLINLLDNALQHAGRDVKLSIRCLPTPSHLLLYIKDDGPGISSANRQKIFQPFFTTARNQGGTGLGLSVVQSLLRSHQGEIALTQYNNGTEFEIRLLRA